MKKFDAEWWASLKPEVIGKETEKIVEGLLKQWNQRQDFAFHRMPDAKAARGAIAAQPGDYVFRSGEFSGFLEVKALKHPYRLPAARLTQLPVLNKWSLAGSYDIVLVHHYLDSAWRVMWASDLVVGVPSWDLRNFETFCSAEEALASTGCFG